MSRDEKSSYYDVGGIETLDVIKAKLTTEQYQGYLLGNAIKYQLRMMHKTPEAPYRDAEKAANYSSWLSEELQRREEAYATKSATMYISKKEERDALLKDDHAFLNQTNNTIDGY